MRSPTLTLIVSPVSSQVVREGCIFSRTQFYQLGHPQESMAIQVLRRAKIDDLPDFPRSLSLLAAMTLEYQILLGLQLRIFIALSA